MSKSSNLIAGLFGTFAVSCAVLVLAQQAQIGSLPPTFVEDEPGKITEQYPIQDYSVEQGRAVYQREGCVTCHTQQIRDPQNGTDIARGWVPAARWPATTFTSTRPSSARRGWGPISPMPARAAGATRSPGIPAVPPSAMRPGITCISTPRGRSSPNRTIRRIATCSRSRKSAVSARSMR